MSRYELLRFFPEADSLDNSFVEKFRLDKNDGFYGLVAYINPNFKFTATTGNNYLAAIGYTAAQRQEFRYNIRGWLTNINNGTLTNDGITQSDPNALFGESIYYNDASPLSSTTPQYNGNISGITWRSRIEASGKPGVSTAPQGNSYDYDNLDRHFKNNYFTYSGGSFNPAAGRPLTETISGYDLMGNIQEMYRVDKGGVTINDQFYYYHPYSNKIDSIYDEGTQSITGTFTYDGNGNLTYDSRKDIHITYNYLDLPDTVSKGSSKLIFTYDAAGNKLYKQLIVGGTVVAQRHYVENLEATATTSLATDGRIDFALMDEGRIVNTPDSGYRYEYYLTDHLGNNRVMFRTDSLGHVKLSMVQNYYPFGSDMGDSTMNYSLNPNNFYKYSNKELQPELDLDSYDFGARHYDAVLGRWMGVDPLAILSDGQSPYNYTANNPINMVDPDGMQPDPGGHVGSIPYVPVDETTSAAKGGLSGWGLGAGAASGVAQYFYANKAFGWKEPTRYNMNFGGVQQNTASSLNSSSSFLNDVPRIKPITSKWEYIWGRPGENSRYRYNNEGKAIGLQPIGGTVDISLASEVTEINVVYKGIKKGLPYIGKAFNLLKRYTQAERLLLQTRIIVNSVDNPKLLRAIEQTLLEEQKTRGAVANIRNAFDPNNKEYPKYMEEALQWLQKNYPNWKELL